MNVPTVGDSKLTKPEPWQPPGLWVQWYEGMRVSKNTQIWRESWDEPMTWGDLHPMSNIWGLLVRRDLP